MTVLNGLDRFHLVMDVIERVPRLESRAADILQTMREKLIQHRHYVNKHGDDMPEIKSWKWGASSGEQREERKRGTEQE
jgi:xylulose-5-phosphate/fructose-6-phosphate phosphoketolase